MTVELKQSGSTCIVDVTCVAISNIVNLSVHWKVKMSLLNHLFWACPQMQYNADVLYICMKYNLLFDAMGPTNCYTEVVLFQR